MVLQIVSNNYRPARQIAVFEQFGILDVNFLQVDAILERGASITLTESGIQILVRAVQSRNAYVLILSTPRE